MDSEQRMRQFWDGVDPSVKRKLDLFRQGLRTMTPGERAAVADAMKKATAAGLGPWVISNIVIERGKAVRKKASDKRTDRVRRTLVGARVPRELAQRCQAAAEEEGVSLYAWVSGVLEKSLPEMGKE